MFAIKAKLKIYILTKEKNKHKICLKQTININTIRKIFDAIKTISDCFFPTFLYLKHKKNVFYAITLYFLLLRSLHVWYDAQFKSECITLCAHLHESLTITMQRRKRIQKQRQTLLTIRFVI